MRKGFLMISHHLLRTLKVAEEQYTCMKVTKQFITEMKDMTRIKGQSKIINLRNFLAIVWYLPEWRGALVFNKRPMGLNGRLSRHTFYTDFL